MTGLDLREIFGLPVSFATRLSRDTGLEVLYQPRAQGHVTRKPMNQPRTQMLRWGIFVSDLLALASSLLCLALPCWLEIYRDFNLSRPRAF